MAGNRSRERLRKWQAWMEANENAWAPEREKMDRREQLYTAGP